MDSHAPVWELLGSLFLLALCRSGRGDHPSPGAAGALALLVFTGDLVILLEIVSLQPCRGYSFEYKVLKKCRSGYW